RNFELGAGELLYDGRHAFVVITGEHHVREPVFFATLPQVIDDLIDGADERVRHGEEIFGGGVEAGSHALRHTGAVVGDDDGEYSDIELDLIEARACG